MASLDRRELRGRVNAKDFAAADPDKHTELWARMNFLEWLKSVQGCRYDNDRRLTPRSSEVLRPVARAPELELNRRSFLNFSPADVCCVYVAGT
jgi:hypothetical protein